MVTFIVLTVGLCAASYLLGVRALPDAAATVAKSGDPLGELVFDLREPTARFMERAMSTSLTDALVNVNETLTRDAGIPAMLGNLILLRATINGLSNTSSMLDTVGGLEAAVNGLPPREATAGNLSAFHNSTQTLKSLLPRQSDALNQLEAQVPTLQDAAASHRLTAVSVRGRHAAPHVRSGPHPRPPPPPFPRAAGTRCRQAIDSAMESAGSAAESAAPATDTLASSMPSHTDAASLQDAVSDMFDAACGGCGSDNGTEARSAYAPRPSPQNSPLCRGVTPPLPTLAAVFWQTWTPSRPT